MTRATRPRAPKVGMRVVALPVLEEVETAAVVVLVPSLVDIVVVPSLVVPLMLFVPLMLVTVCVASTVEVVVDLLLPDATTVELPMETELSAVLVVATVAVATPKLLVLVSKMTLPVGGETVLTIPAERTVETTSKTLFSRRFSIVPMTGLMYTPVASTEVIKGLAVLDPVGEVC